MSSRSGSCSRIFAEDLGRFVGVADVVVEHVAEPLHQLDLVARVGGGGDALAQHLGQRVAGAVLAVDAIERGQHVLVAVVDRDHVAIRLFGAHDIGQLFFVDARQALAERDDDVLVRLALDDLRVRIRQHRVARSQPASRSTSDAE